MRKWYKERMMKDPNIFLKYHQRKLRYNATEGAKRVKQEHYQKRRDEYEKFLGNIACQRCGYNRSKRALSFHHIDPSKKSFSVRMTTFRLTNLDKELFKKEMEKCMCLCMNCHMEIEDGLWKAEEIIYPKSV